jgi:pimeloyl-ACP methyl ester carboxylesterase
VFATLTLPDARTVEYVDLGDPSGPPVLFQPGTPATAGQAGVVEEAAIAAGVRLIGVSRPGYGASSPSPPGLASCASDALALADELGLERFAVLGVSGGGPFALSLAVAAPERLTTVAVHAGCAPWATVMPEVLEEDDRRALALLTQGEVEQAVAATTAIAEGEFVDMRGLTPEAFSQALRRMGPPGPTWLDEHPAARDVFEADFQRAIADLSGYVRDNLSWLDRWDIDLAAVQPRVRLVYGDDDGMVPLVHGQWLQERLPSSDLIVVPGGHGSASWAAAAETFAIVATGPSPEA